MHEMSILTNEVDTVLVYAAENNASWVIEVSLVVGDLRDVVTSSWRAAFTSRGIAEGSSYHGQSCSKLQIEIAHGFAPIYGDGSRLRAPSAAAAVSR